MHRLFSVLILVLVPLFAVGCCPVDKNLVNRIEEAQEIIIKRDLRYVEADATLVAKDKEDIRLHVQKLREAMQTLKKSLD